MLNHCSNLTMRMCCLSHVLVSNLELAKCMFYFKPLLISASDKEAVCKMTILILYHFVDCVMKWIKIHSQKIRLNSLRYLTRIY